MKNRYANFEEHFIDQKNAQGHGMNILMNFSKMKNMIVGMLM